VNRDHANNPPTLASLPDIFPMSPGMVRRTTHFVLHQTDTMEPFQKHGFVHDFAVESLQTDLEITRLKQAAAKVVAISEAVNSGLPVTDEYLSVARLYREYLVLFAQLHRSQLTEECFALLQSAALAVLDA
jgi:hypothetical protein